jgi:hypothetical protein
MVMLRNVRPVRADLADEDWLSLLDSELGPD